MFIVLEVVIRKTKTFKCYYRRVGILIIILTIYKYLIFYVVLLLFDLMF